jgi:hypothetical protein
MGADNTPAEYCWFWSMTAFHVDPALEIATNDRVPMLEQGKAEFRQVAVNFVRRPSKKNSSDSKLRECRSCQSETGGSSRMGAGCEPSGRISGSSHAFGFSAQAASAA